MLSKIQGYIDKLLPAPGKEVPAQTHTIELATAVLLIEISLADSTIQVEEIQTIEKLIIELFGLDQTETQQLVAAARREVNNAVSLHEFIRLLNEQLDRKERAQIVQHLWRVAMVDQNIDKYEEYYVRKIADLLYVSHSDYIRAKHKAAMG